MPNVREPTLGCCCRCEHGWKRDPRRIASTLNALEHYWRRYPDQRLGQIVGNAADASRTDPYAFEDDELEAYLRLKLEEGEM